MTDPLKLVRLLVAVTLLYNVFEGALSVLAGAQAGSLTLFAFGADSYVEVLAAGAVLWRLAHKDEEQGERAEERALRFIGVTFLLLAAGVTFEAVVSLANGRGSETSSLGILLLAASLALMPSISMFKLWLAARTKMPVLAAEAKETVACSYLSLTTFAGLVAVALFGFWWLDAATALLMTPWLIKEGLEGVRAEACFEGVQPCFCRLCLYGLTRCAGPCCSPAIPN